MRSEIGRPVLLLANGRHEITILSVTDVLAERTRNKASGRSVSASSPGWTSCSRGKR